MDCDESAAVIKVVLPIGSREPASDPNNTQLYREGYRFFISVS